VQLDASEDVVGAGQAVTLTWSSAQAGACTASGAWSGIKATSGSESVVVALGEHTYSLTCSDPGAPGSQAITVTGAAPDLSFQAYPKNVTAGDTVTLYWDAAYAEACTASDDWSGPQATQGMQTITLSAPGALQYTMACDNAAGSDAVTVEVTVTAEPALPPATNYRLNRRHDGYVAFAGGITLPATAAPTWTRSFGTNVGPPVVVDGRAFATPRNSDGSYGNRLYGLELTTGDILWGPGAIPGVYWIDGGVSYEDGRLFAVTSDGLARAYDAATGIGVWSRQLPIYSVNSVPVAFGGFVFTSGAYTLYALDAETGEIVWSRDYLYNYAAPAVASSGVYMGSYQCTAFALHPLTGATLWTGETCGDDGRRYVLAGNLLYATEDSGNVRRYDASTGADAAGFLTTAQPIAVSPDITLTMWSGALIATDNASGAQLWQFSGDGKLFTAPIIVNDTAFIGTSTSKLYALDLATGTLLWTGTTSALASGSYYPVITASEGWLIVSGNDQFAAWPLQ
jgi:outer membrane protein assembly factor BamB/plastocyanin